MKRRAVLVLTVVADLIITGGLALAATRNGTSGNDTIVGTSHDDTMRGFAGDDTMRGRGGADTMYGNDGVDNMFGGRGNDDLEGGAGFDVMKGGTGGDTLYGGSGDDTLYGGSVLRFTAIIVNIGAGPFEVHGQRPDTSTVTMSVTQRVYDDSGGHRDIPTSAIMFFSGDGHDHWHVKNLQRYTLKPRGGAESPRQIRNGAKEGFCFFDNYVWNGVVNADPLSRTTRDCVIDVGEDLA